MVSVAGTWSVKPHYIWILYRSWYRTYITTQILKIWNICLTFVSLIQSAMKQVTIWNHKFVLVRQNFEIFQDIWTWSGEAYYCFNSLMITDIILTLCGVMHSTMKEMSLINDHVWPIFTRGKFWPLVIVLVCVCVSMCVYMSVFPSIMSLSMQ